MIAQLKYKEGDRVKVYATLNGSVAETKGTFTRFRPDGMMYVNLDGRRGEIVAHPKQCRRLVKKQRRRVWIRESVLNEYFQGGDKWSDVAISGERLEEDDVEFIEARKKK